MAAELPASSFELNQPPSDGISNVQFSPNDEMLLVSSWDCGLRVYDVLNNCKKNEYTHQSPVLDCAWMSNEQVVSGSLDCVLKWKDISSGIEKEIVAHTEAIRCVEFSPNTKCVYTGSWDKTVKVWDLRESGECQSTTQLSNKVFSMSLHDNKLIIGTAGRNIEIYDIRNMAEPEQKRESALKYQTRCVRPFIEGDGFAVSSTEGRVAMEYFDRSPDVQKNKYAFKCHRIVRPQPDGSKLDVIHPVNVIEFHPTFGTFATGGGDGRVNIWDGKNKKRICQFPAFPTSISSLSFSNNGKKIAIAVSYTFEQGEKDHDPDTIWIRNIAEVEVKPKPRQ